jgi:glucokinase
MPIARRSRPGLRQCVLAIDIGGTKMAAASIDVRGRIARHLVLPIERDRPRRVIEQCAELARALASPLEPARAFLAAGVAVPGLVRPSGTAWAPNLGWSRMPVAHVLRGALSLPVMVESDRNAAVLGESWAGAARGRRHVVALVVGTGIGAGILSDGRLVRGAHELSGCLGWTVVADRHFMERERTGALESVAAGPGIERAAREEQATGHRPPATGRDRLPASDSSLRPHQEPGTTNGPRTKNQEPSTDQTRLLNAVDLAALARQGDTAALALFHEAGRHLGLAIGNVISTLDPEVVVIGGGLSGAADLFLPALREAALGTCQPIAARRVRIVVSRLGNRANLLGAARLAWDAVVPGSPRPRGASRAAGRKPDTAASLKPQASRRSRIHP